METIEYTCVPSFTSMCAILSKLLLLQVKKSFLSNEGDVGMSVHEKERKQEDAYTKTQTHS